MDVSKFVGLLLLILAGAAANAVRGERVVDVLAERVPATPLEKYAAERAAEGAAMTLVDVNKDEYMIGGSIMAQKRVLLVSPHVFDHLGSTPAAIEKRIRQAHASGEDIANMYFSLEPEKDQKKAGVKVKIMDIYIKEKYKVGDRTGDNLEDQMAVVVLEHDAPDNYKPQPFDFSNQTGQSALASYGSDNIHGKDFEAAARVAEVKKRRLLSQGKQHTVFEQTPQKGAGPGDSGGFSCNFRGIDGLITFSDIENGIVGLGSITPLGPNRKFLEETFDKIKVRYKLADNNPFREIKTADSR